MSPFRGVYTLKCTAPLDHHQAPRCFNGEPVLRPGPSLFEQLAQFSPACTCARRSEGVVPHRVRKNTGLQQDRLCLIQCHRIKRPAQGSTISTGTGRKADGKVSESYLTSCWWWRCNESAASWDLGKSLKTCNKLFLWASTRSNDCGWRKMQSLLMRATVTWPNVIPN